ncbi:hypothetical protein [Curtobacterium sp. 8I-2]|jgi:hypothetical protein|uniref:hypothetical protein n=1 Tax=Curtobacterium sp. 8I-2 TaxID=2653136 RepID=UPI00135C25DC|nr:hypothetical protein [Curtobacterium sp. 8I-2]
MKIPPFASEYGSEALLQVSGGPMPNAQLEALVAQRALWVRAERAQQLAVLDAVHGFYLAKRFSENLEGFDGWTNRVVEQTVDEMRSRLWKLAVIEVAGVNDTTSLTRGASLQSVLVSMKQVLSSSTDPDAVPELDFVNDLLHATNANSVTPLRYIRHVRNKWAGHPSMDRDFDSWADADKYLNIVLVEEALALLVRSHQEAAELAQKSPILSPFFTVPPPQEQIVTAGDGSTIRRIEVTVAWENVSSLAETLRFLAGREASALLDQMVSPPGYGGPLDTDWQSGSDHARAREAINAKLTELSGGS